MSDEETRESCIEELRKVALIEHPDAPWVAFVFAPEATFRIGNMGEIAVYADAFETICEMAKADHTYGACGHCDRLAMGFLAALAAWQHAIGDAVDQKCGSPAS